MLSKIMKSRSKLIDWIKLHFYTLYHFQKLVDHYGVHYDRQRFARVHENVTRYQLTQFRAISSTAASNSFNRVPSSATFPLEIDNRPPHIVFQKYFFLIYALRCAAILFVRAVSDSRLKRIWIGIELWNGGSFYFETPYFLWSIIGYGYLRFSFTKSLLDYKFLAVWRISPNDPDYLRAADLRLTNDDLVRLYRYRRVAKAFMYYSTISIPVLGQFCVIMLYQRMSLYATHFWPSVVWGLIFEYWVYAICALIYCNLVQFLVIAKYIHVKQRTIAKSLERCLRAISLENLRNLGQSRSKRPTTMEATIRWWQLIACSVRYSHLQDEIDDYSAFWRIYLTLIFVIYVLLIGFLLSIFLFSNTIPFVLLTFGVVFSVSVAILSSIIYYCGTIVRQNEILATKFSSILARFAKCRVSRFSTPRLIKINNIGISLYELKSGFSLLNGYVLKYETFKLLTINIGIYFILFFRR